MSQLPSGPKPSQIPDHFSPSPFSRDLSVVSVFLPAERVRPLQSRDVRSSPKGAKTTTTEHARAFSPRNRERTRAVSAAFGALIPGQGSSRCPLYQHRETERCCNLTSPPLCHRADQSQRCRRTQPHCHWPTGLSVTSRSLCQQPKYRNNLNT